MTDSIKEFDNNFQTWADNNPEFAQPFPVPYVAPTDTRHWMLFANDGENYLFTHSEIISMAGENDLDSFLRLIQIGKL